MKSCALQSTDDTGLNLFTDIANYSKYSFNLAQLEAHCNLATE